MVLTNVTALLLPIGGIVIIPLLGLSILATTLILERLLFWWQLVRRHRPLARDVLRTYPQDRPAALQKAIANKDLPLARIFLAALELEQPTPEEFRLALESAGQAEIPVLKRFNTLFETAIAVAPLLGLLGTILGLIRAFASLQIGDLGGSNNIAVTAGISEALISTAAGLIVAIVTLLFANLFRSLYRRQIALIQEYGGQLELLYRQCYSPSL
ncbi:MotA/TolQ/ExbB proton channel family protein [Roseofilum casamattae]|uniref:MotA/TolQ/ExbB proton channel family protein n=1 Tax=Roseofilum casamattae BLCC-M143 TaxID=3022442 RepID=A0ABT7BX12_9CYAN|nr:MotA/TolQ/ExbB proton channel family protein [Roseofilum casamattae]MDJ1183732.1 MotA/TolQ/ExbB proton channel family protein [Roseofilum casamattae BLCC-M143]